MHTHPSDKELTLVYLELAARIFDAAYPQEA